jgi:hypothetical protein
MIEKIMPTMKMAEYATCCVSGVSRVRCILNSSFGNSVTSLFFSHFVKSVMSCWKNMLVDMMKVLIMSYTGLEHG